MVENIPLRRAVSSLDLPAVLAFGNPLLDQVAILKEEEFLKKYDFKAEDEIQLTEEAIKEIVAELPSEVKLELNAGGSAQNTMRILQWLCDTSYRSCIGICYGGVGNDARGRQVQRLASMAGVDTSYAVHPSLPTGICLSLVGTSSSSSVTAVGASSVYTLEDLKKNDLKLDKVKVIYIEGFFVIHSLDVAKELVKQAQEKNIVIAFNLNGISIFKDHHAAICEMVGLAKIVFGNAAEMTALVQALNIKYDDITDIPFLLNSLKRITMDISSTTSQDWLSNDGIFVMTQGGSGPAIIVWGKGQSAQVQPVIPKTSVLDTRGAGDALVAGFLAGVLAHWDPKSCLEFGCKVASFMVTKIGLTLPRNVPLHLGCIPLQ